MSGRNLCGEIGWLDFEGRITLVESLGGRRNKCPIWVFDEIMQYVCGQPPDSKLSVPLEQDQVGE